MKNSNTISLKTDNLSVETEGARRATGVSPGGAIQSGHFPDPEVTEKAVRRKFTATYKLRILQEAEACTTQGQIGALLRREGLYSSNLTTWRRQQEKGAREALSPKHRGPKAKNMDPSVCRIAELEKENLQLKEKLKQAETIIDVQKKLSEILQIPLDPTGEKI
ncbi:MAG: helix-turn-helix domain-containing protein [Candidatus Brocadia sp.]|nr:helix-turn-helix domain-containing protein [Candidatus Brocadia sp.]